MNNFKGYSNHFFEALHLYFSNLHKIYEVWQSHKVLHSHKYRDVYVKICRRIFYRYLVSGLFKHEYHLFFRRYIITVEHPSLKCFRMVKSSVNFPYEKILEEVLAEAGFELFEKNEDIMRGTIFYFRRKLL